MQRSRKMKSHALDCRDNDGVVVAVAGPVTEWGASSLGIGQRHGLACRGDDDGHSAPNSDATNPPLVPVVETRVRIPAMRAARYSVAMRFLTIIKHQRITLRAQLHHRGRADAPPSDVDSPQ